VHCTKISPQFECQGQRSSSPGTKKETVRHFVRQSSYGARSAGPRADFLGAVLAEAATPVGKSTHAV